MSFPSSISLTITNICNLRCQMCGQWSAEGYMHSKKAALKQEMGLNDWKRVIDELAAHQIRSLLLRGGEPFLFPEIIPLLEYITDKGIFVSIDTNGTCIQDVAADLIRIGQIHLTISVDGPEAIHDQVRGVRGCFARIREGVALLDRLEAYGGHRISRSINFTISPYSLPGLGDMPDVARSLRIRTITIVPYYYFSNQIGQIYEQELREHLNCTAFSWRGFHHEHSGIDFAAFCAQYQRYIERLGELYNYPYMPLSKAEYQTWFQDALPPGGLLHCTNIEKLIDIQPDGNANFCVDFPDYTLGNVRESTIAEIWNSERAERFRRYRREKPFAVCYRCGAKFMSEING